MDLNTDWHLAGPHVLAPRRSSCTGTLPVLMFWQRKPKPPHETPSRESRRIGKKEVEYPQPEDPNKILSGRAKTTGTGDSVNPFRPSTRIDRTPPQLSRTPPIKISLPQASPLPPKTLGAYSKSPAIEEPHIEVEATHDGRDLSSIGLVPKKPKRVRSEKLRILLNGGDLRTSQED